MKRWFVLLINYLPTRPAQQYVNRNHAKNPNKLFRSAVIKSPFDAQTQRVLRYCWMLALDHVALN